VRGVPAFIRSLDDTDDGDISVANMERQGYKRITYNPYKYETFVYSDSGLAVLFARQVVVMDRHIWEVAA
jgi:hypothetical protein